MGGRADYEERKQRRIERYKVVSQKAREESEARRNSTANRLLEIANGQPILIGHHSENRLRKLHKQADNDHRKAIELAEKSERYEKRATNVQNSNAIYNDDPNALLKLKEKLARLEHERELIKAREHEPWVLSNVTAKIRETKLRIKRLEEQEKLMFPDTNFKGGKAVHNKDINRIQLIFDGKPDEEIRKQLKRHGFHWSRNEGAWQREFNSRTIWVTETLIRDILNKENEEEENEEFD